MKKIKINTEIKYLMLFTLFVFCIWAYLTYNKISFGRDADFTTQHVRFLDYYRQQFFSTKLFLPPLIMNYGGTESTAHLVYYGLLNPYILLSLLLPFVKTYWIINILPFIIMILTYFISSKLLYKIFKITNNTIDAKNTDLLVFIFSLFISVSPAIVTHFGTHIMFYYYYPILLLSYYSLIKIVENKSSILFIITISLLFYTNFFFSFICGFTQLLFVSFIIFSFKESQKEYKVKNIIVKLTYSYITGILLGMINFFPQIYSIFSGGRTVASKVNYPFFNVNSFDYIFSDGYSSALGIIIIAVILIGLLNFKKNKTILI